MNELLQSGRHPDADQLSAFAEHALPPHEHSQTLAHLAVCAHCRAIVSLSLPPAEELPRLNHAPARRPWFSGWNLAWPIAAAFAAMVLAIVHRHQIATSITVTPPTQIATAHPPEPPAPPAGPAPSTAPIPPRNAVATAKPAIPATAEAAAPESFVSRANQPSPSASVQLGRATVNRQAGQLAGLKFASVLTGGGIQGTVTDPDGRPVPNAEITATETDTGVQTKTKSGSGGTYSIQPLPVGPYIVEVVAKGFERVLQENVAVNNASAIGLNLKLPMGGENTTVTVTDAPPNLATTAATLGGTIDNQLYAQLPLPVPTNSGPRDPAAFQHVAPGAPQKSAKNTDQAATAGSSNIYGGTGQANLNQNYVEGVPASSIAVTGGGAAANTVSVDAINQFSTAGLAEHNASATVIASDTSAATLAHNITLQHPLPSGLPAISVVAAGHRQLAIDTGHSLFLSNDDGLQWKPVSAPWKGRAVRLNPAGAPSPATQGILAAGRVSPLPAPATAAQTASADNPPVTAQSPPLSLKKNPPAASPISFPAHLLFEITTDTGEHWVSPDGLTWTHE
jgi:hypothetical protein